MRAWKISVSTFLAIVLASLMVIWSLTQPFHSRYPAFEEASADPARLKSHVEFLTSRVAPRDAQHPENLDRAAEYISTSFSESGFRGRFQEYRVRDSAFKNVIATAGPASGPALIFCAHYDAAPGTPGADDNASGVAGLLELARLIREMRLTSRVELVAVSTEEPPFFATSDMGSHHYAESLEKQGTAVSGVVVLEMLGFFGGEQRWPSAAMGFLYPGPANFISVAGRWQERDLVRSLKAGFRSSGVPAHSYSGPVFRELTLSDHRNFWKFGFDSALVSDTAYLRNPNYHTPQDRPETLNYTEMAKVVDGLAAMVAWEAGRNPLR